MKSSERGVAKQLGRRSEGLKQKREGQRDNKKKKLQEEKKKGRRRPSLSEENANKEIRRDANQRRSNKRRSLSFYHLLEGPWLTKKGPHPALKNQ